MNESESTGTESPGRFLFFLAIYSTNTYLTTMFVVLSQAEILPVTYDFLCAPYKPDTVVDVGEHGAGHHIDRDGGWGYKADRAVTKSVL